MAAAGLVPGMPSDHGSWPSVGRYPELPTLWYPPSIIFGNTAFCGKRANEHTHTHTYTHTHIQGTRFLFQRIVVEQHAVSRKTGLPNDEVFAWDSSPAG